MLHYSTYTEKRAFPRFMLFVPANYCTQDCDLIIYTNSRDISTNGMCIFTEKQLPCNMYLDLCLEMIDTGEQIQRRGCVVWSNIVDTNTFRAGIRLEDRNLKPIELVLRTIKAQRKY